MPTSLPNHDIDATCRQSAAAFAALSQLPPESRAQILDSIAAIRRSISASMRAGKLAMVSCAALNKASLCQPLASRRNDSSLGRRRLTAQIADHRHRLLLRAEE